MVNLHPSEDELRSAYAFVKRHPFPSIPDVLNQISDELSRPEPDLSRLIELINGDIALAGLVLKTINSAGYGYGQIESVQQALTLLGLERIKNLVMATYIQKFLPVKSAYAHQLLEDSRSVAHMALQISRELHGVPSEEAYIAGLMLDSGALFLAEYLSGKYEQIYDLRYQRPITLNQIENMRIGSNHSTIGYLFARHWKLPDNVSLAIYLHHGTPCERLEGDRLRSLLAVLKLADYLVARKCSADAYDVSLEQVQNLARIKSELMIDSDRMREFEGFLL